MWSHCKFISTDGTGHDSVNHRFESKLTQFGWETTKKGSLWRGAHFKGFQAFSGSGSITCFITFPDSSTKYFETPAIQIGAVLEDREASGLFANDVTRYHIDRQRRKRGKRRGDKVCSFSLSSAHSLSPNPPSSLTCQCSPSSKACLEHIEVQAWSSPFQWCSIRFWDKFSCGEYYESKHLGKQSWNEQILSIFLVTFCMLRTERNSSSIFWFTPDHSSVRIDDNSSQIQPEKCRGQ